MSICISLVSVNWISWPRTPVVWLRHCLQGVQCRHESYECCWSGSLQWNLIGHSKFNRPSPRVPSRMAATMCREGLAATQLHYIFFCYCISFVPTNHFLLGDICDLYKLAQWLVLEGFCTLRCGYEASCTCMAIITLWLPATLLHTKLHPLLNCLALLHLTGCKVLSWMHLFAEVEKLAPASELVE